MLNFSLIMSVYKNDEADHLVESVESATIRQTVKPRETILVVDGPVGSDIEDAIKKLSSSIPEFKVVRLEKNSGLARARQVGIENASCAYIAVMDGDDISLQNRFEKQVHYLVNHPEVDVLGGSISEFIGDQSNIVAYRNVPSDRTAIKEFAKRRCPMNHVTVMFRKEAVLDAGGYKHLFCDEDYYLWIRLIDGGFILENLNDVLVNVRVGDDMYKRRGGFHYFQSEKYLQDLMLSKKMIGISRYVINVAERFALQVLMPNRLRQWAYEKFARETKANKGE